MFMYVYLYVHVDDNAMCKYIYIYNGCIGGSVDNDAYIKIIYMFINIYIYLYSIMLDIFRT